MNGRRHARRYGDDIDESSFLENVFVIALWIIVGLAMFAVGPDGLP